MLPYDTEIIITYHEKKEITIPFSERSLRNMNYVEAGDRLQELGFTEIYEKPIRDLVTGWVKKDGAVEKVTIDSVHPFKVIFKMKKSVFTSYDELPLLLNVKQLADLLGVSDSSVYELIQEDDFPSLRIGKRIVIPKEELRKWISAHTKGVR